jgi:glycine betaine/proline transport system substrate-binding protein
MKWESSMTNGKFIARSALVMFGLCATTSLAQAGDPESCKTVRISDGGWTDNTAINGLLVTVLKGLGYQPKVDLLAMPIALEGLKNNDLDIWLDNWMPSQTAEVTPYLDEKTIESVAINLDGAGYGPVVPQYVADAGVKDIKDLGQHTDKFDGKFYGIEPGNDGNRIVQAKLDDPANNLDGWELVESSEQGMLAQVERSMKAGEWVAFLAWTPHPVMGKLDLHYLSGFEADGFGSATVHTLTRANYTAGCPNVGALLKNLKFSLDMEGDIMEAILAGEDGEEAAAKWLKASPASLAGWLQDVTTFDGQNGLTAVESSLGL